MAGAFADALAALKAAEARGDSAEAERDGVAAELADLQTKLSVRQKAMEASDAALQKFMADHFSAFDGLQLSINYCFAHDLQSPE